MKDKLITIFTLIAFLGVLGFGSIVLTLAMVVIIPLAILRCMFSTNENRDESV